MTAVVLGYTCMGPLGVALANADRLAPVIARAAFNAYSNHTANKRKPDDEQEDQQPTKSSRV